MRVHVPIQLRWGDLDAYNHVNNVEVMRLLEEARVRTFWETSADAGGVGSPLAVIDAGPTAATNTLISRHEVEYLVALPYRGDSVDVQLWIGRIGGASLDVCYEVVVDGTVHVKASSTIVLVDSASGRPRRITNAERAAWQPYHEPPVEFRGRR
ncbi:thioesterase family protein [Okibacterium endophyticum]